MTETVLREIVHRAVRDGSYRAQLQRDPAAALAGYALGADERSALISGDPARLTALGVDQRMSKAFTVGLTSEASKVIALDAGVGGMALDEAAQTVRSFNWRTEQNIDTLAASAAIDDGADASGIRISEGEPGDFMVRPDVVQTERSFNWLTEQDLDGGDSLKTIDWPGEDHQTAQAGETADAPADGNTLTEY